MIKPIFVYFLIIITVFSCAKRTENRLENISFEDKQEEEVPQEYIDNTPVYQSSRKIQTDLIHTKLEIRFDWVKQHLLGKATITAKQHFYASDSLILDAQGMEIKQILCNKALLKFTYDSTRLFIQLDKKYIKDEKFVVEIDYVSRPNEIKSTEGIAIKENKGLYFINPKKEQKEQMPQIWTQGETQSNSVWFPTIDAPNVKSSQEMYITVENKYETLSNGKLLERKLNQDGTRTDHWYQNLAHAPYLFMLAVGEFKIVTDSYTKENGEKIEVNYYVEPEWESSAKSIFGATPEMIGFFSKLTGIEYPWDKYHQIVVRDYVSGAMENTGAVIFGDFVYKNQRELLDANDESVIAHELFHHWFGDLVTCESWANLPLNESFANYSQYLWDEYKHGVDQADYGNEEETNEFLSTYEGGENHDLIWYSHTHRDDMFDKHSYNKGGRVLHMLRSYLGDEAFFAGLKNYLQTNKFKATEIHHLRLAFEEITGEDLHWFFNQWFLNKGIPELSIEQYISEKNKEVVLTVTQTHDLTSAPLYRLPIEIAVYDDAGKHVYKAVVDEIQNKFVYPLVGRLKTIVFDQQHSLLAKINEVKPFEQFAEQYYLCKKYQDRKEALLFGTTENSPIADRVIVDALQDPFWKIRATAIEKAVFLKDENKSRAITLIQQLAQNDKNSNVRAAAIEFISQELDKPLAEGFFASLLQTEKSYLVIEKLLLVTQQLQSEISEDIINQLQQDSSSRIKIILSKYYAGSANPKYIEYFTSLFQQNNFQGYEGLELLNNFTYYISTLPLEFQKNALPVYKFQNTNGNYYAKLYLKDNVDYLITVLQQKIEESVNETENQLRKHLITELEDFKAKLKKD
jgi:aminopeptidase N